MVYKNKNIRFYYSVAFTVFIIGAILMAVSLLIIILNLAPTAKKIKNEQHLDTVLQDSGNHASRVAYFDITEALIFLGKEKKAKIYLISDGKEYRLAELDDKEYKEIKAQVEAAGSYRIEGMTEYIVDSKARNSIASEAGKIIGENVSTFSMDKIFGDVCIICVKVNFFSVFYHGIGLAGVILGIISALPFFGGLYELRTSRKVISLGNITAKDIDEEANKEGSIWLDSLRIYLTENMVLGIISDAKSHEGQVALKYDEIQQIYGYNKIVNQENPTKNARHIIEAVATDGNKYILSDAEMWKENLMSETEELFQQIKDRNSNVKCEPDDVKYKTFRFRYALVNSEGKELSDKKIDDDTKQDIMMKFAEYNPLYYFKPADAVLSMKISFPTDGIVEITAGIWGDKEVEVKKDLFDSLEFEFMDGWNLDYSEDDDDYDGDGDDYDRKYRVEFKEVRDKEVRDDVNPVG